MLSIRIDKSASAKLLKIMKTAPQKVGPAISIALTRCAGQLSSEARMLAPYDTGTLKRSITIEPQFPTDRVEVGSNLNYAKIHDQGGVIPAHMVTPKKGKALRWFVNGRPVFSFGHMVPKRTVKPYKGRGYLTPAFNKLAKGDAQRIFAEEIQNILK